MKNTTTRPANARTAPVWTLEFDRRECAMLYADVEFGDGSRVARPTIELTDSGLYALPSSLSAECPTCGHRRATKRMTRLRATAILDRVRMMVAYQQGKLGVDLSMCGVRLCKDGEVIA